MWMDSQKAGEVSFDLGNRVEFDRFKAEEEEIETIHALLHKTYIESWIKLTEDFIRTVGEEMGLLALERSSLSLGMTKGEEYSNALRIADSEMDSARSLAERVLNMLQIPRMDCSSGPTLALLLQIEALCRGILKAVNPDYEPSLDDGTTTDGLCQYFVRRALEEIRSES